jgi:hypothetical protein
MINWLKNVFKKPAVDLTNVSPTGRVYGHLVIDDLAPVIAYVPVPWDPCVEFPAAPVQCDRDAPTLPSMEVAEPCSWLFARDLEDDVDDTAPTAKMSAASEVELVATELFEGLKIRARTPPALLSEFGLDEESEVLSLAMSNGV